MVSKKLTRFFAVTLILLFVLPFSFGVKTVRAEGSEITVFSVEDYIDTDVLDAFEEETGVKVNYLTFATNEEMYNELLKDKNAVDLICPSEYMIMKMRDEGLLKKFDTPQNFADYGSDYIKQKFKQAPLNIMDEDESKTYAIGYMWGTIGVIYRTEDVDGELLKSWSSLWSEFDGKLTVKDSIRDTYFMALAEVYKDELISWKNKFDGSECSAKDYNAAITEIFNRTDKETVDKVEKSLLDLKGKLYGFEVDAGKSDILTGKINVNVAWSGDAVFSIDQGLYDEDGEPLENQVVLGYAVPEEGSNVWFDGYVMTANADEENSLKFLDYLCSPEVATLNMDYTGYTSCIVGDEVFEYVKETYSDDESEDTVDLRYFFDPNGTNPDPEAYIINVAEELKYMFYAQYPTEDVLTRCAVMKNFDGDELERINEMWKKIKLITFSTGKIIAIVSAFVFAAAAIAVYVNREKLFGGIEKRDEKKSKYKLVSKEEIRI
ncbi:MAG TPA: hypothetical protein DEV87_05505 [Clostridiales bacterium]|nr:hypothetical protein [Clostridiales bacterium]